jgi:sugar lactone lactonase YvrE
VRVAAFVTVVLTLVAGGGAWASSGGGQRWVASYRFGDKAFSDAVAVTPDGSTVFVTGTTDQGESDSHFATLAYEASTGAEKWVATFKLATDHDQYGRGNALAVSPDGSTVYVTGSTACFRCDDASLEGWATIAYDVASGDRLWVARFLAGVEPGSVAVSPEVRRSSSTDRQATASRARRSPMRPPTVTDCGRSTATTARSTPARPSR